LKTTFRLEGERNLEGKGYLEDEDEMEDNIKLHLKELKYDCVDWIHLQRDREQ
jgi:hypothetical protein